MITHELTKTVRREARESYARFILSKHGLESEDIEEFLNTPQAVLENKSPLDMIYTGDYERAVIAVELFVEGLEDI